jgi:peptide/nickel transport system substrate-binding protein
MMAGERNVSFELLGSRCVSFARARRDNARRGAPRWRRHVAALAGAALAFAVAGVGAARAAPEGQLTWAVHVSLPAQWFDPGESPSLITPTMVMYALHDAMVKPMPGQLLAPSLAEKWSVSSDGLSYEFVLRKGVKFHNGDELTSEDVKFTFERYKGGLYTEIKEKVASVETPDPYRVVIKLKQAWPDFMTFYSTGSFANWIVPKKHVEKVGAENYKKAPVGAGPYKLVSYTPGVELVLEAHDQYWRKPPNVKRLVFKTIPEESTRLAALKRGEVDIAYSIRGELAEELQRIKGMSLKATVIAAPFWLYVTEQWDPKSPWHDIRLRQALYHAIDHKSINEALTLGFSKITGSIIPDIFEFYWQPPLPTYDPAKAKKLLAEAGFPNGIDAGDYHVDSSYANLGEAIVNGLQAVGIRVKMRPVERAALFKGYSERTLKGVIQGGSGAFGNAATRLELFAIKGGPYAYGNYPDIDEMFREQSTELDQKKREALLHKIQQLADERRIFAPIWQLGFINGLGPRVAESGLGHIAGHPYSAPYEDVAIKGK